MWTVRRAAGQTIPSGGTLVIGREQDCEGGCFESGQGASGKVEWSLFSQDFTGLIDELRIWRTVRSQDEIMEVQHWPGSQTNMYKRRICFVTCYAVVGYPAQLPLHRSGRVLLGL